MFTTEVFTLLPRSDQRAKGFTYLRGLLLDGRRKSMQPMAERLGVDHQGLQRFITSSTWDFTAIRRRLATRAIHTISPQAWAIDDTGFVKDGIASPGVARQYSGTLGKVGNCQIGVSVHALTDTASCPLSWRLFLPTSWDDDHAADPLPAEQIRRRRARCAIPDDERHCPKWQMAIEMLNGLAAWELTPPIVVADTAYGDNARLRAALDERGLRYVVQVKSAVTAHDVHDEPEAVRYRGTGRPPRPYRYRTSPISLREHVLAAGRAAAVTLTWRGGSKGDLTSQFVILPVRVAGRRPRPAGDGSLPVGHLIAQWPDDKSEPITRRGPRRCPVGPLTWSRLGESNPRPLDYE
ncbi:IS701 family transposase [Streptosporangium amethystogenes]|uniref:IS701 family transposase n=1 Tax=Streptosporangium amethystogenes TaxID=2002 RepID=UPI003788C55C